MRTAFAVLISCVLMVPGVVASHAQPGDRYDNGDGYYRDGYRPRPRGNVWYSSDCCYKKIVRHIRQVRYVRVAPPRRYGYGPYRPWREGYYRPRRPAYVSRPASFTEVYVGRPQRFEGYPPGYVDRPRYDRPRYDNPRYDGYDAYNSADVEVAPVCHSRRIRVLDGKGGWVWGLKKVCY